MKITDSLRNEILYCGMIYFPWYLCIYDENGIILAKSESFNFHRDIDNANCINASACLDVVLDGIADSFRIYKCHSQTKMGSYIYGNITKVIKNPKYDPNDLIYEEEYDDEGCVEYIETTREKEFITRRGSLQISDCNLRKGYRLNIDLDININIIL